MKKFFNKIFLIFVIPLTCILISSIIWDPFKIFFGYPNDNTDNTGANRENYCLRLLEQNTDTISNFIVGSSRSLAFRTDYWSKAINMPPTSCFHYDGSGMGLYRITNAIEYLSSERKIENVLIVMDISTFSELGNRKSIFSIQPPKVSKQSRSVFYFTFIKASLDPIFIISKIVYFFTNKYYDFMEYYIPTTKFKSIVNQKTGDVIFSYDQAIKLDSIAYYRNIPKMYELYDRQDIHTISEKVISDKGIVLLQKIKKILNKQKINTNIVISPLYDQMKLNKSDLELLQSIFGKPNVFDFSGINNFTKDVTNYYESSHYKPVVANKIIDEVYSTTSKSNQNHQGSN
jgi:hypothetical protein